jgi:hypothetical protein
MIAIRNSTYFGTAKILIRRRDMLGRIRVVYGQIALILIVGACAPWNQITRETSSRGVDTPGNTAYIESQRVGGRNYGCSFIEFDGRGGMLDFNQLTDAKKVLDERKRASDVLLVIYCHGWNNNAQSGDVLRFVSFLRRLSDSTSIQAAGIRVEGVYLAWRGSQYLPAVSQTDETNDPKLKADFGGDLIDHRWNDSATGDLLLSPGRYGSYWSIKDRAEFYSSRVPLARAVFTLAYSLKSPEEQQKGRHHRVFVIGHSFGALLLEQAIGQASVGLISSDWSLKQARDARWPFDLIVFLNSAAPSLYAKQLGEFLEEDHKTSARPKIVSITSEGDWATGIFHPLGNWAKRFASDLQREYQPYGSKGPEVPAWKYYDATPGHNPYLINYSIDRVGDTAPAGLDSEDKIFSQNLQGNNPVDTFYTQLANGKIQAWRLRDLSYQSSSVEEFQARRSYASNYWITTVSVDIIKDHTDIWSLPAMEMLAGVYRISEQLSKLPPRPIAVVEPDGR